MLSNKKVFFLDDFAQKCKLQPCCWRVWTEVWRIIARVPEASQKKILMTCGGFCMSNYDFSIIFYLHSCRIQAKILFISVNLFLFKVNYLGLGKIKDENILLSLVLSFTSKSSVFLLNTTVSHQLQK